ncbi:HAMP domain-containing methyl-accepting chemotaxis protein [Brevibacillus sp. AY1]|uniref:methyl-accepting chemotaxis protein n=1 Tax=Brevibacillus sp. AY1 TaxID=2807621 RepID=UPI00245545E6|nr:HAMP domain-containing methyl-accepting chemotaxis protein [Brevibacillus sp. AY1]MDH4619404.1 methyl-accepting chemotaxis protein [Brevibacillus sp. AY1]
MIQKFQSSILTKNLSITILGTLLIGIILVISSYIEQEKILLHHLTKQSVGITEYSFTTFTGKEILDTFQNDFSHPSQQNLTSKLNLISEKNKEVAQAYFFGAELQNGNQTKILAFPTHIIEALTSTNLKHGDMYEQPPAIVEAIEKMKQSKTIETSEMYKDMFGTWISVLKPVLDENNNVIAYYGIDMSADIIEEGKKDLLKYGSLILLISLIIIAAIQFLFIKGLLKPVHKLQNAMSRVGQGDLQVSLPEVRVDEFGELSRQFNQMVKQNREMIINIQQHVDISANTADQLSEQMEETSKLVHHTTSTIQDVAKGAENQLQGTEESARTMAEMAIGVQRIAESVSGISDVSNNTTAEAQNGNLSIQAAVTQMQSISNSVQHTGNAVKLLAERSTEIEKILDVITSIASQTNLLALNAAIEAARAGEHGRGFAVVADEVRKLAEQSDQSARQISSLIQEILVDTDQAMQATESANQDVQTGLTMVQEAGQAFNKISLEFTNISEQIQELSAVAEEMAASSEEVTASIDETANIAKQSVNFAIEVASSTSTQLNYINDLKKSAEFLNEKATELSGLVRNYKA